MTKKIIEKMRNPHTEDGSWISLRQIEVADDGTVTSIRQLDESGVPLNVAAPLALKDGQFVTDTDIETVWITYPDREETYTPPDNVNFWLVLSEQDLTNTNFDINDALAQEGIYFSS